MWFLEMMIWRWTLKTASLESRWERLSPDSKKPVFQLVDANHPLDFYIGRNPSGARLLLLVTEEKPESFKQLRSLTIDVFGREDGKWSLLIGLSNLALAHVFTLLCEDLIEGARRIPHADSPVSFVMNRLSMWQKLLEKSGTTLLSEQEVRGLAGELLYLSCRLVPALGLNAAIRGWVGPLGGDQDFQIPDSLWEVKTVRGTATTVNISSELQLFSLGARLTLVLICIEESSLPPSESLFSLNSLVDSLRKKIAQNLDLDEVFESKLTLAGYQTRPEYDIPVFRAAWIREYDVTESFPRIIPPMLSAAVSRVGYEVLISACDAYLETQIDNVKVDHEP